MQRMQPPPPTVASVSTLQTGQASAPPPTNTASQQPSRGISRRGSVSDNMPPVRLRPDARQAAEPTSTPSRRELPKEGIFARQRDKAVPDMQTACTEVRELTQAIDKVVAHRQAGQAAGATLTVNESAIRDNIQTTQDEIAKSGSGARLSAVIKADAYGLGAPRFARILREAGVTDFFVARTSEAVELRQAMRAENAETGDDTAVFLLDGPPAHADMAYLIEHKITPVLNSLEQVAQWNEAGKLAGLKLPAILQFDTGMSRAGLNAKERQILKPKLQFDNLQAHGESDVAFASRREKAEMQLEQRNIQASGILSNVNVLYLMSHLGNAGGATKNDDGSYTPNDVTARQRDKFEDIRKDFPGVKATLAASSGIFLGKDYHYDMVRGGGVFHGQAPFGADDNPLRPVVKLTTTIEQGRTMEPEDWLGYSGRFVATEETDVALANIGYADGLNRIAGSNAEGAPPLTAKATFVAESGERHDAMAIGATSMDMNTYNVTGFPPEGVKRGTTLNLIDEQTTLDHFGGQFGTNAAEFETKITKRVHREVVVDPEDMITGRQQLPKPVPANLSPNAWAAIPHPASDTSGAS